MKCPAIGDWLIPKDHTDHYLFGPGIVVDILPSGKECVLSRQLRSGQIVETAHLSSDLRGLMRGRVILTKDAK